MAYGLNNHQGYRTRFINGSVVHRRLSGPKLQKVFDAQSKSKMLPIHRKCLLKQIETTYGIFKSIRPHDLSEVLKDYQDIDIKLYKKRDSITGYTIYDKSGYLFTERELSPKIRIEKRLEIFGNADGPTEMDTDSKQFKLETQKLMKEALFTSYLKYSKPDRLLSENISTKSLPDILPYIIASMNYICN